MNDISRDPQAKTFRFMKGAKFVPIPIKPVPDTEALRFAQKLSPGWNLGNTFDAAKCGGYFPGEMELETAWCGTGASSDLIRTVKNAGFHAIRLPVSWHNHIDNDLTISSRWLSRIKDVVDDCIREDLYVILNIHHDIDPTFIYPTSEHLENTLNYVRVIWAQLSKFFGDYDDRLIFESVNEPRVPGNAYEWNLDFSVKVCQDMAECVNQINQAFVDVVRASNCANSNRFLMIPGYSAAPEHAACELFRLPEDTVRDRLLVSVHVYRPIHFALMRPTDPGSVDTFDVLNSKDRKEVDEALDMVYNRFVRNDIPVVVGEFGALAKHKNELDRAELTSYFMTCAAARGIPCFWWDNNLFDSDGENFGLLDRKTCTWRYPTILNALMNWEQNSLPCTS